MAEGQFQDPRESWTDSEPEPAVPEYLLPGPASPRPAGPRPARPEARGSDWTVADVQDARFSATRLRPGYKMPEVDAFLARLQATVDQLTRGGSSFGAGAILTPEDVRAVQFGTTRLKPGYDEEEVDIFLTRAEAELARLISQRDDGGPGHAGF
ncbi:MAG TPA: DivIVA domain-containing protein [Trebonia sp.]|nr:DivIVA domain-containing protein [Trebonia sp.]